MSNLRNSFTAMARVSFGLRGAYLPILLLVFENIIFVSHEQSLPFLQFRSNRLKAVI